MKIPENIPISPKTRVKIAWMIFIISMIGWPLSGLTVASGEPPFILALSWWAIALTALDILSTTDVRATQESDEDQSDRDN